MPLRYVRPNILALAPYSTARDEFEGGDITVYIDANESPFATGFNRYPDPRHRQLKEAIGRIKGVEPERVFIGGAGSDEAIDLIYRIFCTPGRDNVIAMSPTYGVYSVAAAINDIEYREVAPGPDYSFPVEAALAAADSHSKVIWVCSPNNPTGLAVPIADIERLATDFDGIVAVDEAYIDFSPVPSALTLLDKYPNIIVLQTFSKAWGLANLRVGMAFSHPSVAALMANVKYPYNLNGPTQREILHQLSRDITPQVRLIIAERSRLASGLEALPCIERVYHSDANFLLVKVKDSADALYSYLISRGVLVRNRSRVAHCADCLRITVGTPEENTLTLKAIADYCSGVIPAPHTATSAGRTATVSRHTSETDITVSIDLDGDPSVSTIHTGLHFFDHMLYQLPHHGGFRMDLRCHGDLEVDEHHTMEDVAIALGEAILLALGDKRGIERYGFSLPMDEVDAQVLLDLGGRIDFRWDVTLHRERVGDTPTEMYPHFFHTLACALRANLHITASGHNDHHIIEGIFKATARALRMAVRRDPASHGALPSSKGTL